MSRARTSRPDEGGAVLLLMVLAVVTLMTSAALAVDLGSLAATNRRLQGVADLAAIAASNELNGRACNFSMKLSSETVPKSLFNRVREAAVTNAATNNHAVGGSKTLLVEVGVLTYDNTGAPRFQATHSTLTGADCMVSSVPSSVRVTAGDYTKYAFGPAIGQAGRTSVRSGIAGRRQSPGAPSCTPNNCPSDSGTGTQPLGAFRIGSSVANLDTNNAQVLSSVLDSMLCPVGGQCKFDVGATGALQLVSYQGLAAAGVTLGQLQTAVGVGSMTALLSTSLTAGQLYVASAKALGCTQVAGCTNTAAVTLLNLSGTVTSNTTFKLSNLVTVASGTETMVASTTLNVLDLVTGSAAVINGTNFVYVPVTTVSIPGGGASKTPCGPAKMASTCLEIKIIQGPATYRGPVGGFITTSQATVKLSQDLNLLNVPITGSLLGSLATVTGSLPINVTGGSAKGTLTQAGCAPTLGESVSVDTNGSTTTFGGTTKNLEVKVGALKVADMSVSGSSSVAGVSGSVLSFVYPTEYEPATTSPKHVGGTTLDVQGTPVTTSLSTLGLSVDVTAALTGSTGTLTILDTTVISPVLRALGIASADVWAIGAPNCVPIVVG